MVISGSPLSLSLYACYNIITTNESERCTMDKILETKKSIKKLVKSKSLTRMQRHNLVIEELNGLDSTEQRILRNEYSQDIKSCARGTSIREYFEFAISSFALIFSLASLYFNSSTETLSKAVFSELLTGISLLIIFLLLLVTFSDKVFSNDSHVAEYALDIFAELEAQKNHK